MNAPLENPRSGTGCVGKGCTTLFGLLIFLLIALAAGTFFGIRYLRSYSAEEPLPLPVVEKSTSAVVEAPPITPPPVIAQGPTPFPTAAPSEPAPSLTPPSSLPMAGDWKSFQKAAKRGERVQIALSDGGD